MLEWTPSGGLAAVPETGAAVNAFFAFKGWDAFGAFGDGLAGTHGDAGLFFASDAEAGASEDYVVGEAGHGLDLAAHQECVLLSDEETAVEGDLRPAAGGEQGVVKRTSACLRCQSKFGEFFRPDAERGRQHALICWRSFWAE